MHRPDLSVGELSADPRIVSVALAPGRRRGQPADPNLLGTPSPASRPRASTAVAALLLGALSILPRISRGAGEISRLGGLRVREILLLRFLQCGTLCVVIFFFYVGIL